MFVIPRLIVNQHIFHIINLILITRLSEWLNERAFVSMIQVLWTLPCVIALRWWPGVMVNQWGTYALVTVLTSYPYCRMSHMHKIPQFYRLPFSADAILVGWTSKNSNNVGTRSVSAAVYNVRYL